MTTRGKGKYWSTDNTKIGIKVENVTEKIKKSRMKDTNKIAHRKLRHFDTHRGLCQSK